MVFLPFGLTRTSDKLKVELARLDKIAKSAGSLVTQLALRLQTAWQVSDEVTERWCYGLMVCESAEASHSAIWKGDTFSFNGGSAGLAAQEGRNIENVLLDRIVHRGGPAVRIEALRSRLARKFRSRRRRSSFGLAGRRAQRRMLELR